MQRGSRQTRSSILHLFVVYIKSLVIGIRQNAKIKGTQLGKDMHKLSHM